MPALQDAVIQKTLAPSLKEAYILRIFNHEEIKR